MYKWYKETRDFWEEKTKFWLEQKREHHFERGVEERLESLITFTFLAWAAGWMNVTFTVLDKRRSSTL